MRSRIAIIVEDLKSKTEIDMRKRLRLINKGFLSESYILYNLENNDINLYLSDFHRRKTRFINGDSSYILNNKIVFDNIISKYVKTPKIYSIILKGEIFNLENTNSYRNINDLYNLLKINKRIVLKPFIDAGGGKGVYVVQDKNGLLFINGQEIEIDKFDSLVKNMDYYIACEYIEQSSYGHDLFPNSLNTIRILTMKDPQNYEPFIAFAVQRIGTKKSGFVDNWTSGGLSSNIDLESGELSKAASFHNNSLTWHSNHPDTGNKIEGNIVPNWNLIKEKVLELANKLPYLDYIGWDIVPFEEYIIVIEANNHSDVNLLQVHKPLLKNEKIKSFYLYHEIIRD